MNESIWTRQGRLEREALEIEDNENDRLSSVIYALEEGAYQSAADMCTALAKDEVRRIQINNELEDVTEIVETFERITERMEKLEAEARQNGWRCLDD